MIHLELKSKDNDEIGLEGMIFKLRGAEQIRHGHIFRTQPRLTISHVLLAVKSGEGRITIEGEQHSLSPDSVFVCKPGQTYGLETTSADYLELYLFRFDIFSETNRSRKRMQMVMEGELHTDKGRIAVPSTVQTAERCEAVYSYWKGDSGLERFRSSLVFQELLYYILGGMDQSFL
ncbi:AraC family ligand binding domain-containing protein [Paenibacillus sp. GCM10012307]|uniref:AraC family ligand binding domain-containing protein n=1 Tax=Paenibacillus roseus TaxID=2798579 RepID=A0A934MW47_9BACL|nr:AraC family ligand binding domain-containing protein [Paenibacillus roseus]MBJ6362787.1 AraC family ligand binding domain-containing protein [Paenibacillus roseus]